MTTVVAQADTWLNIGSGPHRAPYPWLNLDCVSNDIVKPDLIIDPRDPVALFGAATVDRVYAGHVLEHIPWDEVPAFLADVARVLKPGGELMAVGPDAHAAIGQYRDGTLDWETVTATLEDVDSSLTDDAGGSWPNARHHWNCRAERLRDVLGRVFGADNVSPVPVTPDALADWPVVSFAPWQCAVRAVNAPGEDGCSA